MERKRILFVLLFLFVFNLRPRPAQADIGPKPSLDIIVKGLEGKDYWLDLLVQDQGHYSNLEVSQEELAEIKKLIDFKDKDGYHPALLQGTDLPLFGDLKGKKQEDGTSIHHFSYVGTPQEFKIALLTEDNTLLVSDLVKRRFFNAEVEFNLVGQRLEEDLLSSAGHVRVKVPVGKMMGEFFLRVFLTLALELALGLLFGFTLKKSGPLILKTNLLTQVILNLVLLASNLFYGLMASLFLFFLIEIGIVVFETVIYAKYMIEKTKRRRIIYGVLANLASCYLGLKLVLFA